VILVASGLALGRWPSPQVRVEEPARGWRSRERSGALAFGARVEGFGCRCDRLRFASGARGAVPYITVSGLYLGWLYRHHGYRLVYSVAEHFWYDFALSAVDFALDPAHSELAARITIPF
jgi:hypothetical protein